MHVKGLNTDAEKQQFSKEVQKWIETQVAKHKFLRGGMLSYLLMLGDMLKSLALGVVVIDAVPKR